MEDLIVVKNVTKRYPNVKALDDVNLTLSSGKIIGLLGPNGSGKTTLIKIIAGLIKNYSGEVKVENEKIGFKTKSKVAYLADHDFLSERFTVKTAIAYYTEFFADFDKFKAIKLLEQFDINLATSVKSLSKGNREKLQLILTLSRNALVYVFDEPIAGVDPASRDVIFNLIMNNLNEGSTVLISTHLISDIESILDEVIFIKKGKIVLHKDKEELMLLHEKSIDAIFREVFKC